MNGYDETTTDEIAERAGVSPRTFFRYFPTKESVLFVGEYGWFQSFTKQFLSQPEELTDLAALRETIRTLAPGLSKIRPALALYERAVASSPTLRGGVVDRQATDIATIAEAIATRRGLAEADESCTILATVILVTYRRGVMRWLGSPRSAGPREMISEEFDLLLTELAPGQPSRRRRQPQRARGPEATTA